VAVGQAPSCCMSEKRLATPQCFGDLAIAHPHDIDGLELNLPVIFDEQQGKIKRRLASITERRAATSHRALSQNTGARERLRRCAKCCHGLSFNTALN
jgi:hypothetical protein